MCTPRRVTWSSPGSQVSLVMATPLIDSYHLDSLGEG
jgi:hypothetical protein